MAIQYYMRAFNTNLSQYVDWTVNDAPDTSGTYSGYPTNQLTNIIVNRVINSKVDNFLKSNQSLGGFDGYFFHINSYDWIRATAPINPPSTLTGFAVERGITSVASVSGATNATPIVVTTSGAHGLATDALVTINGVQGNITANGTFPITVLSPTTFSLNGSQGTAVYTTGGTVYVPNSFSTLTWDEPNSLWRFVSNTNGDGTTLGSHQSLRVNNSIVDGYQTIGGIPSGAGVIRLPNNQFIFARNATNTGDIQLLGADNLNRIKVGNTNVDLVYMPGSANLDGYLAHGTANVATTGFIREQNSTTIIAFRDSGNTNNINVLASSANGILLGDAVNTGVSYNTSTGNVHTFQVNSVANLEIGTAFVRFPAAVVAPSIYQVTAGAGSSGQTLTIQAQNGGTGGTTGGIAALTSGTGGTAPGTVDLSTGATLKVRIHPTTAPLTANNNSIQIFENRIRIDSAQTAPRILQDDNANTAITAAAFALQAQNATGAGSTGGALVLSSGTGTTTQGNVFVQTGGVNQIIVSPNQTTILGNLLVNGTTTSVASTVVDIADRVVHYNSSANVFPGTIVAAPTQITGFSIDRGSPTTNTKRDYYGLFWVETDSLWKFAANPDGYTSETTLSVALPSLGSYYVAQPNAAVVAGTIPTAGGFRSLNNTTAVSSRNAAGNADLLLLGSNATNQIVHGSATNNGGHVFNTTTGTTYDFQVNSASAYVISPVSAGTTTLQAASTVTAILYGHTATASATGANTTLQAQNATTTGGNLVLTSGTGTTAGNIQLQSGGVDKVIVRPTFTEFRDTSEAFRITPISAGATVLQSAATVTSTTYRQADVITNNTNGFPTTIQAQNATGTTSTGGNLVLTSGTGTTAAGDVALQTGGVSRVITHPSYTEFRDTAEAVRITPISAGTSTIAFADTVTAANITQSTTVANIGATLSVTAQAAAVTGGNLVLGSGNGATTAGNVLMQVGGTTTASAVPNKFVFNRGRRRNVTTVTTTYQVLTSDDLIAITTLAAAYVISLPATPTVGDMYEIKDTTGIAGVNVVTVSGNGSNIDGVASFLINQPYQAVSFVYVNGQWSVV